MNPVNDEASDRIAQAQLEDRTQIVDVIGEADVATSQDLRARLEAISAEADGRVVVDLSSATFIDSSTLGVLAVAAKRFREVGHFAIVCPPGEIRLMFELTALERVVDLYPTRAEALAALESSGPSSTPPNGGS